MIRALDVGFKEFEFLLKQVHLGPFWRWEVLPNGADEVIESGMIEPECFKAKRATR